MGAETWEINGTELTGVNVTVLPDQFRNRTTIRQQTRALVGGSEHRTRINKELPELTIRFDIYGAGDNKYTTLTTILDIIEDDVVWTLKAPDNHTVFVFRNFQRAALSTTSYTQEIKHGTKYMTLSINAIVNGAWLADGGDFVEVYNGYITRNTATDYDTVGGEDDLTARTSPEVKIPEQSAGYPKGYNNSTLAFETITGPASTVVEGGVTYAFYDMTNYVHESLDVDGDVGVFEIHSSPTTTFLDG